MNHNKKEFSRFLTFKFKSPFGPFGSSTGFFLFAGGLVATWFSPFGLLITLVGAFAAFTTTRTSIDTEKMKVRHSDNLFGLIPVGKWISIQPGMSVGLKKSHRGYTGYIRGTQPMSIHYNDLVVLLFDQNNKPVLPLMKCISGETSKDDLNSLSSLLGLPKMQV